MINYIGCIKKTKQEIEREKEEGNNMEIMTKRLNWNEYFSD